MSRQLITRYACDGCGRFEEVDDDDDELPFGWMEIEHETFCRVCTPKIRTRRAEDIARVDAASIGQGRLFP